MSGVAVLTVRDRLARPALRKPVPEISPPVLPGDALDYLDAHPSAALLVVEVADDSLYGIVCPQPVLPSEFLGAR